jgi:hypothetical protein
LGAKALCLKRNHPIEKIQIRTLKTAIAVARPVTENLVVGNPNSGFGWGVWNE